MDHDGFSNVIEDTEDGKKVGHHLAQYVIINKVRSTKPD